MWRQIQQGELRSSPIHYINMHQSNTTLSAARQLGPPQATLSKGHSEAVVQVPPKIVGAGRAAGVSVDDRQEASPKKPPENIGQNTVEPKRPDRRHSVSKGVIRSILE